jgi:coenzyme F420-reducing hydrogenase alpha subunit
MKTIKKFWAAIVGAVLLLVTLGGIIKRVSDNKKSKIDKKIDDNKNYVSNLQGKIDAVETQRDEVKDQIQAQEQVIAKLEDKKENIVVEERTVSDAKENILKKTKRGRKPNKKS